MTRERDDEHVDRSKTYTWNGKDHFAVWAYSPVAGRVAISRYVEAVEDGPES